MFLRVSRRRVTAWFGVNITVHIPTRARPPSPFTILRTSHRKSTQPPLPPTLLLHALSLTKTTLLSSRSSIGCPWFPGVPLPPPCLSSPLLMPSFPSLSSAAVPAPSPLLLRKPPGRWMRASCSPKTSHSDTPSTLLGAIKPLLPEERGGTEPQQPRWIVRGAGYQEWRQEQRRRTKDAKKPRASNQRPRRSSDRDLESVSSYGNRGGGHSG